MQGHESIVHFVEASAATLVGDGWEIFILMEYCAGGGLIDFLNTRLRHRLHESEVLSIFQDVCEGIAVMHHLSPPLVHRDIKIENVLLTATDTPRFKLCDFGSCFSLLSTKPAVTSEEIQRCEKELNQHTTVQYRAPEMMDLGMHVPITEKADIWALGVFLYKLCYYTTPFEGPGAGPAAILRARFTYPAQPSYSNELRALIDSLLQVRADARPDIDTVLARVSRLLTPVAKSAEKRVDAVSIPAPGPAPPPPDNASTVSTGLSSKAVLPRHPAPVPVVTPPQSRWPPSNAGSSLTRHATVSGPSPTRQAARSPGRPDSLVLDVALDDVTARFPSMLDFDKEHASRRSVRSMVQELDAGSPPRTVSIPMDKTSSNSQRSKPDHTLVDVDLSSSEDEDEQPEDVNTRVRPIMARPHHSLTHVSPADSLRALLSEHAKDEESHTSHEAMAPEQEELATIAEHEKALRALLGQDRTETTSSAAMASPAAPSLSSATDQPTTKAAAGPNKAPAPRRKPSSLSASSRRPTSFVPPEPPVGTLVTLGNDPPSMLPMFSSSSHSVEPRAPAWEDSDSLPEQGARRTGERGDGANTATSRPSSSIGAVAVAAGSTAVPPRKPVSDTKRTPSVRPKPEWQRSSKAMRRSSTWDAARPASRPKTFVDEGTSPGLPSSPVDEIPPVHGISQNTPVVVPEPQAVLDRPHTLASSSKGPTTAQLSDMLAHQRDGRVRLTRQASRSSTGPPVRQRVISPLAPQVEVSERSKPPKSATTTAGTAAAAAAAAAAATVAATAAASTATPTPESSDPSASPLRSATPRRPSRTSSGPDTLSVLEQVDKPASDQACESFQGVSALINKWQARPLS